MPNNLFFDVHTGVPYFGCKRWIYRWSAWGCSRQSVSFGLRKFEVVNVSAVDRSVFYWCLNYFYFLTNISVRYLEYISF